MKKVYFLLAMISTIITFTGIVSVLTHRGNVTAGAAVVPSLFAVAFIRLFQKTDNNND